jgi:hypothetical protein
VLAINCTSTAATLSWTSPTRLRESLEIVIDMESALDIQIEFADQRQIHRPETTASEDDAIPLDHP